MLFQYIANILLTKAFSSFQVSFQYLSQTNSVIQFQFMDGTDQDLRNVTGKN